MTTFRILTDMYGNRICVKSMDVSAIEKYILYEQRHTEKIFENMCELICVCELHCLVICMTQTRWQIC